MQMTHKHDVYFSPHSTEAHNLVMQIADYCNKRGIWYKIYESTLGIGIEYGSNVAYVIDADRKTESQTIVIVKDHGRKQALEMIDSYHKLKTENCSEIPNNCEHITEDGVTCAKYPACDGCLDNPLNKVKGSERLVKGSEQTEPTISKMEQVEGEPQKIGYCNECKWFRDKQVCGRCRSKNLYAPKDEPQTERSE